MTEVDKQRNGLECKLIEDSFLSQSSAENMSPSDHKKHLQKDALW